MRVVFWNTTCSAIRVVMEAAPGMLLPVRLQVPRVKVTLPSSCVDAVICALAALNRGKTQISHSMLCQNTPRCFCCKGPKRLPWDPGRPSAAAAFLSACRHCSGKEFGQIR